MSSETSIDAQGLQPWQFFLLAGMLSATAVVVVSTGQSPASIIMLSVTVVAASFVAVGAYRALSPLVHPEGVKPPEMVAGHTRAALEREKTLVLRSIKELEFDFAMAKMTRDDFEDLSGRLRARAIGLMRQLDAGVGYRDEIERELAKRVGGADPGATKATPSVLPRGATSATPSVQPEGTTSVVPDHLERSVLTTCPSCEGTNDPDARFCKHCGTKLAA